MFGEHIGQLHVYVKDDVDRIRVYSVEGGPDAWELQSVTLNHDIWRTAGKPKRIMFVAVRGAGISGDIAIDDITLNEGVCPLPGKISFFYVNCKDRTCE